MTLTPLEDMGIGGLFVAIAWLIWHWLKRKPATPK